MKILHVITSLYTGGAERLMVDLLPQLRNKDDNQVDLLLINGVETPFKEKLIQAGINVYELSMTNDVYNARNILRFRRFFKNTDYDIIHTHNTACQLFVPLSRVLMGKTGTKLVTTEHSTNNRRRLKWWLKPIDKWMYKKYAAIVCIAPQAQRNLESYIGKKDGVCTISNGVDTKRFIRPIKDISGQQRFVVTMVAALRVEKDHATLLKAMTRLPEQYSLQIVGGGPKEVVASVKAMCSELGLDERVSFLGVRMDVPDIMEQSDVIVLSSHWEGLSLSSIEGMASGRPFIASDVEGLRDTVSGAGLLFPHGDDAALAQAIQDLCDNPAYYRQIATACQERAKQYDISLMAEGYNNLYRSLSNG